MHYIHFVQFHESLRYFRNEPLSVAQSDLIVEGIVSKVLLVVLSHKAYLAIFLEVVLKVYKVFAPMDFLKHFKL